jgi:hypothetical protein
MVHTATSFSIRKRVVRCQDGVHPARVCLVHRVWCIVSGVWCLVSGVWCLVSGATACKHKATDPLQTTSRLQAVPNRQTASHRKPPRHHCNLRHQNDVAFARTFVLSRAVGERLSFTDRLPQIISLLAK